MELNTRKKNLLQAFLFSSKRPSFSCSKKRKRKKFIVGAFIECKWYRLPSLFLIHLVRSERKHQKGPFCSSSHLATSIIGHRSVSACVMIARKKDQNITLKLDIDVTLWCPRPLFWIKMYKSLLPRRVLSLLCMYVHTFFHPRLASK